MAFQQSVSRYLAPGVKGGWASANPHASLLQSNNGDLGETATPIAVWMTGTTGVTIGQFAYADTVTGLVTSAKPAGTVMTAAAAGTLRIGFVQRDQFALITPYMAGAGQTLFQGQPITLLVAGDVWAEFAAGAAYGQFSANRAARLTFRVRVPLHLPDRTLPGRKACHPGTLWLYCPMVHFLYCTDHFFLYVNLNSRQTYLINK